MVHVHQYDHRVQEYQRHPSVVYGIEQEYRAPYIVEYSQKRYVLRAEAQQYDDRSKVRHYFHEVFHILYINSGIRI